MAMREMAVMDATGDTKISWDTDKPAEVENARRQFDAMRAKGYAAYRVGRNGATGEIMQRFDPEAGDMILSPAMVGG